MGKPATATIVLMDGTTVEVKGTVQQVVRDLATDYKGNAPVFWHFTRVVGGTVYINPHHVMLVKPLY